MLQMSAYADVSSAMRVSHTSTGVQRRRDVPGPCFASSKPSSGVPAAALHSGPSEAELGRIGQPLRRVFERLGRGEGQVDDERGAQALLRGYRYASAHPLSQFPHDGQPETGATCSPAHALVDAVEAVEDAVALL